LIFWTVEDAAAEATPEETRRRAMRKAAIRRQSNADMAEQYH
jgi:hypothetical protein